MINESLINSNNFLSYSSLLPSIAMKIHTEQHNGTQPLLSIREPDLKKTRLPEILFITSYPPRECGIATYSQDLIKALNNKFDRSFAISICPLETGSEQFDYPEQVKYVLNTDRATDFLNLSKKINNDDSITMVVVQHEFGLFENREEAFRLFLDLLNKPVVLVFHTVLPNPNTALKASLQQLGNLSAQIIVMTQFSAQILVNDYEIANEKIEVIPHGTHLVPHADKKVLKAKYGLSGKKVLSTFGLLSSGKNMETTLDALPAIVAKYPDVLFLAIGKTHPTVVRQEGEAYRQMLEAKVVALQLQDHVKFINQFLPLPELLEYLQLTDIYLFTSKDPNQAVSGTFSYAISCGCPIVSTPIPHAREVLKKDAGITIDFGNSQQLGESVISLLRDADLRKRISSNGLHRMASTAWENTSISHAMLFEKICEGQIALQYSVPGINLDHIKKLTTDFGMIQFSKINQPDIGSGYTLDDNARALIALCKHFELYADETDLSLIRIYFNFIRHCMQDEGYFLNYVDEQKNFSEQNNSTNLADANGRAIWALGYLISLKNLLPATLVDEAELTIQRALLKVSNIHSTRAMAFIIKGLYYRNLTKPSLQQTDLVKGMANRLIQMYRHEMDKDWQWFESYLTYANSILPESLLCAWMVTGDLVYKQIAKTSFDFLLSKTFTKNNIKVISNKSWLHKGTETNSNVLGGEQPIDVAYTILALNKFYQVFKEESYRLKMETSFNWFLGNNHLHQVIYNPCTGGCYDGLEENYVNLNQGAESTVSYLMARLTMEMELRNPVELNDPFTQTCLS